ncbi:MAG: LemA family protein [bacterium]
MFGYIVLIIVVVLVLWTLGIFNKLVSLKTRTEEAWSDIDVQLKRRYDLIPNIVNTVKGFAAHEEKVLTAVTEARNMAMNAKTTAEHSAAENQLTGALKTLFAVAENYPDLKTAPNFLALQQELANTEEKIQSSRRFYNANVRDLNMMCDTAPSNIVANIFKFAKREFFEINNEAERQNVEVKF